MNGTPVNVIKTRDSDGYITVTDGDTVVVNYSEARNHCVYSYATEWALYNGPSNVTLTESAYTSAVSAS